MQMRYAILILLSLAGLVQAADVYVDGVRLEGIARIDITTTPAPTEMPRLVPGNTPNWPETEQPPVEGVPDTLGHTERPIARWHVPCFESYRDGHVIGLVAFHACGVDYGDEGIRRVEFTANDGAAVIVKAPTRHPETGYWGWWAALQPAAADGLVEIRAVVVPHAGRPRVLQGGFIERVGSKATLPTTEQSLLLWSNAAGTFHRAPRYVATTGSDTDGDGSQLKPFATISRAIPAAADFTTIYLSPGTYAAPRTSQAQNTAGWLTIRPAVGVDRADVLLDQGDGTEQSSHLQLVRLQDLTIRREAGPALFRGRSSYLKLHLWFHGCDIRGPMQLIENPSGAAQWYNTASAANRSRWSHYASGPAGRQLLSGIDVADISGDVFSGNALVRDFTVERHIRLPRQHADIWQGRAGPPNRIFCDGVISACAAQVLFFDNGRPVNTDAAMVNVAVHYSGGDFASQFGQELRHVLIWHCNSNQRLLCKESANLEEFETFVVHGNVFNRLGYSSKPDTRTFEEVIARGFYWSDNKFTGDTLLPGAGDQTCRTVRWDARQQQRHPVTNRGATN